MLFYVKLSAVDTLAVTVIYYNKHWPWRRLA